jgi:hypothetical protein
MKLNTPRPQRTGPVVVGSKNHHRMANLTEHRKLVPSMRSIPPVYFPKAALSPQPQQVPVPSATDPQVPNPIVGV